MASKEIKELLDQFSSLKFDQAQGKVICSFTKHEMPPTLAALKSYINGKKFKKAASTHAYNYDQHKPHLVPSTKKKHTHELFCKLTLRHIGKSPDAVETHVNGKRYKKALARYEECKATGIQFVPRAGGRQKKKVPSDSDSAGGEDWTNDDDKSSRGDTDDDMSDLYPAEDFESEEDDDSDENDSSEDDATEHEKKPIKPNRNLKESNKKKTSSKQQKAAVVYQVDEDSGSDYDLGILDKDSTTMTVTITNTSNLPEKKQAKGKKRKSQNLAPLPDSPNSVQQKKKKKMKILKEN